MPHRLAWTLLHFRISTKAATLELDKLAIKKPHVITVSNDNTCNVCEDATPHVMRYRIYACKSTKCTQGISAVKCPWRCKVLTCADHDSVNIFEIGQHLVRGDDPPSHKLTRGQKEQARSLAGKGLRPFQIVSSIAEGVPEDKAPKLRYLQHFVTYYRRKEMKNTDNLDEIEALIKATAFTGNEDAGKAFAFSVNVEADGTPQVGEGTDENPFLIGYTTKKQLQLMDRPPESFVFHLDATFKTNQVDYPVVVCGVSDATRTFHLVALFVVSQRKLPQYTFVLSSLKYVYRRVLSKPLQVRYVLGDAEDAQYNAVQDVFGDCSFDYLMCFFHVLKNVLERGRGVPYAKFSLVIADIYDMHSSRTPADLFTKQANALERWLADPDVAALGQYIFEQWMSGRYASWQCFFTPPGFATTNNPVETFNSKLKTFYTLRQRLKMGFLLTKLALCCENESRLDTPFATAPVARSKLKSRATALRRQGLLKGTLISQAAPGGSSYMIVLDKETPHIFVRPKKRTMELIELAAQFGKNTARMEREREHQPETGWAVDLKSRSCPCDYFFKYGQCVHLLYALYESCGDAAPPKRMLFSRRSKKRSLEEQLVDAAAAAGCARGRPILNGPALSFV